MTHDSEASAVRRRLILLFLAAATLRVAWVGARYGRDAAWDRLQYPDEEAYVLSARSLAAGRGLIDEFGYRATYMPGYPAFLALFVNREHGLLLGRLVQALLSACVAPAAFLLAREFMKCGRGSTDTAPMASAGQRPRGGRETPLIAGALAAMDPFLVFFSGLLLTEALFAAFLVSAWVLVLPLADRARAPDLPRVIGAALLLFAAVMLRPGAMVIVLALACALPLVRGFDRAGWAAGLGIPAVVIAALLPWAVRNRVVIGQWQWLTTRGGISLYDGVRATAAGDSDLAHTKLLPGLPGMRETEWDAHWRHQAWAAIRSDAGRMIRLAGHKFLRTWSLRPNVAPYRSGPAAAVSALWMTAILLAGLAGWWMCRRSVAAWFLLLLPVLVTTAMHLLFVGSVRYRVPVMPMLMVLAASALPAVPMRRSGGAGQLAEK